MFGGGAVWGNLASSAQPLAERERPPPARPIPLEFPNYSPSQCGSPLDRQHMEAVREALASVRRPSDIKDSYLDQLNVQLTQDVDLTQLVPEGHFESRPFLFDDDLTAMLQELDFDNEDCYREILRLAPLEGKNKIRLTYSRNFFVSLEDMSRYWDSSRDNYYEVEAKGPEPSTNQSFQEELLRSQGKTADTPGGPVKTNDIGAQPKANNEDSSPPEADTSTLEPNSDTVEIPTRPKMKVVYKGPRLGNGEQMSPATRVSAVRNLLKMAIHKFNCRDFEVNPRDRLRITSINIPSVFYSFCVARVPPDISLARARMVEGPLLAVFSRSEVRFKSRDGLLSPTSDFMGEKFDFFREIGSLLLLAKQRAREGIKISKEPAEHQWWAIKARWGGGESKWGQLANEVYEDEDPSWSPEEALLQRAKREKAEEQQKQIETAAVDPKNLNPDDLIANTSPGNERPKKKKRSGEGNGIGGKEKDKAEYRDGKRLMFTQPIRRKWYQEWTKIRPNAVPWDEKVIPRRIGMQSEAQGGRGWDQVYSLSAVNHHVCIIRMSIHKDYLEWLETGQTIHPKHQEQSNGDAAHDERQPHILYVSRSRWYDLFEREQRKELLTGIWRVMCWLSRDELPKEAFEQMDQLRRKHMAEEGGDHHMEI